MSKATAAMEGLLSTFVRLGAAPEGTQRAVIAGSREWGGCWWWRGALSV